MPFPGVAFSAKEWTSAFSGIVFFAQVCPRRGFSQHGVLSAKLRDGHDFGRRAALAWRTCFLRANLAPRRDLAQDIIMTRWFAMIPCKKPCAVFLIFSLLSIFAAPAGAGAEDGAVGALPVREDDGAFRLFNEMKSLRSQGMYRLGKGDVLNVIFFGLGAVSTEMTVGPDGYVILANIGSVKLSGLTLAQAEEALMEKLGDYLLNPDISITMTRYGTRQVFVMGEVKSQGVYSLTPEYLNIFAALSSAGGIMTKGRPKHVIVARMVEGAVVAKRVNFDRLVKKQDYTQNVLLEDGDMIYVPKSNKFDLATVLAPIFSDLGIYKIVKDF
jgi:polysaccharide export outer membrane protein